MNDAGGPLTASDLIQILAGNVMHMRALELRQQSEIIKVAEEMPSTSLILTPDAVKRVLTGLLNGEILPEQAQTWGAFVMRGYISTGCEAIRPILVSYESSHEDEIAEAVARLEELGDLIDGTLDADENRLLLKQLDK